MSTSFIIPVNCGPVIADIEGNVVNRSQLTLPNTTVTGTFTQTGNHTITGNETISGTLSTNTLQPFSGTTITIPGADTLDVNTISPTTGTGTTFNGSILIPSANNYINVGPTGNGPTYKRIISYEASQGQGTTQYSGFYGDFNVMGIMLAPNNNIDIRYSTGTTTSYLGHTLLGQGGHRFYYANNTPSTMANTNTLFSESNGNFTILNSSGFSQILSKSVTEAYISSTTATALAVQGTSYGLKATTWAQGSALHNFTLTQSSNAILLTYNGNPGTFRIVSSMTISSDTANHNVGIGFYKNPTFTGNVISAGTLLNSSQGFTSLTTNVNVNSVTTTTLATNDVITIGIADNTGTSNITAQTGNIFIESIY